MRVGGGDVQVERLIAGIAQELVGSGGQGSHRCGLTLRSDEAEGVDGGGGEVLLADAAGADAGVAQNRGQ